MSASPPPSPPATRLRHPSWLDLRLVVGVLLVLASVLLGIRVVAGADRSVQVWSLARDVAAGTELTAADLRPARVRLFDQGPAYVRLDRSPAGRVVTRQLRAGELLPAAALDRRPPAAVVAIPVKPENAPGVTRGQLVDVWVTGKDCAPTQVLTGVAVQDVLAGGGGALSVNLGTLKVVVRVSPDDARRTIAALGVEGTIRLVVLDGVAPQPRLAPRPVGGCVAAGRERSSVAGSGEASASDLRAGGHGGAPMPPEADPPGRSAAGGSPGATATPGSR